MVPLWLVVPLCWCVLEGVVEAVEVVDVVGPLGPMCAAVVVVTGTVVVLLVWLLDQSFAVFGGHPPKGMPKL